MKIKKKKIIVKPVFEHVFTAILWFNVTIDITHTMIILLVQVLKSLLTVYLNKNSLGSRHKLKIKFKN